MSKNFKKKSKGKSDDKKLKVKPKTFSKEIKSDNSVGVKRKAKDTDGVGTKQFKMKKWKGEKQHDARKKGLLILILLIININNNINNNLLFVWRKIVRQGKRKQGK